MELIKTEDKKWKTEGGADVAVKYTTDKFLGDGKFSIDIDYKKTMDVDGEPMVKNGRVKNYDVADAVKRGVLTQEEVVTKLQKRSFVIIPLFWTWETIQIYST